MTCLCCIPIHQNHAFGVVFFVGAKKTPARGGRGEESEITQGFEDSIITCYIIIKQRNVQRSVFRFFPDMLQPSTIPQ